MLHSTTVLSVRYKDNVAIGGDGQVTLDSAAVIKHGARKIHKLHEGKVIVGFAGGTADAFALMEKFEAKLKDYQGSVMKAAYELARDWRTDRALRRLESLLIVVDKEVSVLISGNGDVIAPDDGILGIGSGGGYAISAARALVKHSNLTAKEIVEESLLIAAGICVYTNDNIYVEDLK